MQIDDPNTPTGEQAICFTASKAVGRIPLGGELVSFVCSGFEAQRNYVKLRKFLLSEITNPAKDQEQILYFAGKLMQTASFGAQRSNFRMYYIDGNRSGPLETVDPHRVKKLPENPKNIMYGFWR